MKRKTYEDYKPLLVKYLRIIKPRKILEWGPGPSTKTMREECPNAKIITCEHDYKWFNKWLKEFDNINITLLYLEGPIEDRKDLLWNVYTNPPVEGKFDLIFVDGRERVRCMRASLNLLSKNGVLLLHDANRRRYKKGVSLFVLNEKLFRTLCLKLKV